MRARRSLALGVLALQCGCAAILEGTSQIITLESNPPGARCEVTREGRVIGTVEQTPGIVHVKKTKHDMDVVCRKSGVGEGKVVAESGTEGAVAGNIILGGGIGWAVDSAMGADNKYPERIIVNLGPVTAAEVGGLIASCCFLDGFSAWPASLEVAPSSGREGSGRVQIA